MRHPTRRSVLAATSLAALPGLALAQDAKPRRGGILRVSVDQAAKIFNGWGNMNRVCPWFLCERLHG